MEKKGRIRHLRKIFVYDKDTICLPRQAIKIVLKPFENQGLFKIKPEFTTLLRQMKSSYDKYVVKEVKYDERKTYEEQN